MKTQWLNGRTSMLGVVAARGWTPASSVVVLEPLLRWRPSRAPPPHRSSRTRGADISFTLQEEGIGQSYSDNGQTAPLETILAGHDAN